MLKKDIPNGIILYEGPSVIDGKPIVVIANSIKVSKNKKLGQMVQTWILRSDVHPQDALKTDADISICGDCIHRGKYDVKTDTIKDRTCYVNLMMDGVFAIYNAYKRGSYPKATVKLLGLLKDRHVRFGSYGDPAAVPFEIFETIKSLSKETTGYTHRWKLCDDRLKSICMASVETYGDYFKAKTMGWRTFFVKKDGSEDLHKNEISCLAQTKNLTCEKCNLCNGADGNSTKDIAIIFHGAAGRKRMFDKKMDSLAV